MNKDLVDILLRDKTTGKNIIWATNDYKEFGYEAEQEINSAQVVVIRPRYEKIREHQKNRTRDKAEIFTPSKICKLQNDLIDEGLIKKNWKDYVTANVLEITCGEAPYLVSRYDTVSGESIPLENRIGLLDRKLRVVGENIATKEEWLIWTKKAFQSVYGYEFQGDNLFIARKNLLLTYVEYYEERFNIYPKQDDLKGIADIISWNLWQMDGLTNKIPYAAEVNIDLFGETQEEGNIYCKIKDWENNMEEVFKKQLSRV